MADDVHEKRSTEHLATSCSGAAAAAFAAGGARSWQAPVPPGRQDVGIRRTRTCDETRDIILHNGKFIDYRGVVASQLTVKDGRIGSSTGEGPGDLHSAHQPPRPHGHPRADRLARAFHAHGHEPRLRDPLDGDGLLDRRASRRSDRAATIPAGARHGGGRLDPEPARRGAAADAPSSSTRTSTRAVYLSGRTNTFGAAFFAGFGITTDPSPGRSRTPARRRLRFARSRHSRTRCAAPPTRSRSPPRPG